MKATGSLAGCFTFQYLLSFVCFAHLLLQHQNLGRPTSDITTSQLPYQHNATAYPTMLLQELPPEVFAKIVKALADVLGTESLVKHHLVSRG